MGKQPSFDIPNSGDSDGITNYNSPCTGPNCAPTATITNKGWGDFRKGLGKFGDVAEASVNITKNANKFLSTIDHDKQLGDATHQSADGIHGIDNPDKGNWTYQQEGILKPDHQTKWIAQKGAELYKAQIGIPPIFDNTKKEKPIVYTLDEKKYNANQDSTKMHDLTLKQMEMFPKIGSFRNAQKDFSEKGYIERLGSGERGVHFDLNHFKESGKPSQADLDFIKEIQATGVQPAYYTGADPLSNTIKHTKEWQGLDPITGGVYDKSQTSWNPYYPEPQVEMKFGYQPQDVKTIKVRKTPDSNRSVVDRMVEMGMDPSFNNRKGWHEANFPDEDYKGSPKQNNALNKHFEKQSMIRAKTGGNPFGQNKRQLRKRTGGQVANISTEVLKKLQATKGSKFNIL